MQKIKIEFDAEKRNETLITRGLDMARAGEVLAGRQITFVDKRFDYGETRWVTFGHLDDRLVVLAWTYRSGTHRIISMRKANGREQKRYARLLGK